MHTEEESEMEGEPIVDQGGGTTLPEPGKQAEAIKTTEAKCREASVKPGLKTFLVGNRWFTAWCQHTGFTYNEARQRVSIIRPSSPGPNPGPIDNSDLLAECQHPAQSTLDEEEAAGVTTLRSGLVEKKHFWALCEPTWELLKGWYGVAGPEIVREYMQVGLNRSRVEMDPGQLHVKVVREANESAGLERKSAVIAISELCTVINLLDRAAGTFGGSSDDFDALDASVDPPRLLEANTYFKTLRGVRILDQQTVIVRQKPEVLGVTKTPSKPRPMASSPSSPPLLLTSGSSPLPSPRFGASPSFFSGSPLSRSGGKAPSWAEDIVILGSARRRGLTGLGNLGNTCFMNSSVQCLAHTVPVLEVFLSGVYKKDCNADNPLGLGGKLALAFGGLVGKLWLPGASHVNPKHFKWQLSKFAPQFQGYAQQDSQELLAFLLDGLHEDLNRIRVKPYVEEGDADGRPDAELAAEAWRAYRARNDSVIVDHFQGMYKSTLVCPQCGHQSVKFDPFMYLSLPLPGPRTQDFRVTVLSMDGGAEPRQYSVTLPKTGSVGGLQAALAAMCQQHSTEKAGLPSSPASQPHLLLARWTPAAGGGQLELLTEAGRKLAGLVPARPAVSLSSGSRAPQLLGYLYADVDSGPAAGRRAVLVHHRITYSTVLPPAVLFLSTEDLEGLKLARIESSTIGPEGSDNVLSAALLRSLRPFQLHSEPDASSKAQSSGMPVPMDMEVGQEPADPAVAEAVPDAELVAEPIQDGDMEMQVDGGDAADAGPQVVPIIKAEDEGAPFDMFAAQAREPEVSMAGESLDGCASQIFTLKLANAEGRVRYSLIGDDAVPPALPTKDPLCFLAEWSSSAARQYGKGRWDTPAKHRSVLEAEQAAHKPAPPLRLQSCVEAFLQMEQLDAEDSWYCSKCKQHVQANKKLDLWSLPEVLVVHLKRFSYSRASRDKLDTKVEFPLTDLDLGRHILGPASDGSTPESNKYDLYAVSNHYGGLGGGHYTAYCKMPDDNLWYLFDDGSVRCVPATEVQSPAAYVLFYRRQGSKVALQEILEDGAGIPIASDMAEVAGPEENGHRPALRASLQLETIDSDDELMGDPLHEDLDISPA
uniref:ubiquitinyl hydrolase 1 n=1 Tax=Auxenochlorella protothecoides TaxID=3075 RepID=A0A1D2AEX7_AUXPR